MDKLYSGRALAAIDLLGSPKALRGSIIDNTMPMVRLSPAECAAIRAIAAPGAPQAGATREP